MPVTDSEQAQEIFDREFDPEIHKIPVTKEYMACAIGGHVEVKDEKLLDCFSDALYESVAGMIYKLARKYSCSYCRDDISDLAHDCVLRIFKMIHQYDPAKAGFNTWAWYVASSVLNRNYQKTKRHLETFVNTDETENFSRASDEPQEMNGDIAEALKELFDLYPERNDILRELFCWDDGNMYVPDRISMRRIAEDLGREYTDVYSFVRNKVRPFMAKKFRGKR
jgi:RNA polymerase sigma factor (sigma-70 family)